MKIIEFIYLFSAFHGLFLVSILFFFKRSKNIFLSLMIMIFSYFLIENVFFLNGYIKQVPHLYLTSSHLSFLIPPLFYHFICYSINPKHKLRPIYLFHLTPFVYELIILTPFYLKDSDYKMSIYEKNLNVNISNDFMIEFWFGFVLYMAFAFWFFKNAYIKLKTIKPTTVKGRVKNKWLMIFTISMIIYLIARIIITFISHFEPSLIFVNVHFKILGLILIIHGLAYLVFLYPEIIVNPISNKASYKFSKLSDNDSDILKEKLLHLLSSKRIFLAHDLSPEQVAVQLGITKDKLSQLLSNALDTNFYGLVNSYRVEEAKKLLRLESYENAKIIHIAYDSGFSNKSSFLRNFKKITGKTPSQYKS